MWATKNPPKKEGMYLVTITTTFGSRQVRQAQRCCLWNGEYAWNILPDSGYANNVVAWQKCPEPWKEQ